MIFLKRWKKDFWLKCSYSETNGSHMKQTSKGHEHPWFQNAYDDKNVLIDQILLDVFKLKVMAHLRADWKLSDTWNATQLLIVIFTANKTPKNRTDEATLKNSLQLFVQHR